MKILNRHSLNINVKEMVDGQIAVITEWPITEHVGTIVQRYGDDLIALGKSSGNCWSDSLGPERVMTDCCVEILLRGTTLEL